MIPSKDTLMTPNKLQCVMRETIMFAYEQEIILRCVYQVQDTMKKFLKQDMNGMNGIDDGSIVSSS
jgi:hypothetical protein